MTIFSIDNQQSRIENRFVLSSLGQRVLDQIRRRELMRPGDRVAIAVSGGADSVALLRLMLELRGELGVVLSVAHFNHRIRGEASDRDELFVRELAAQHGVEFHRDEGDAPSYARARKLSLEAAARELRYGFFDTLVDSGRATKIATAHTLDDQAETVLMRVIRGTGIAGLGGIRPRLALRNDLGEWDREIVRPLLSFRRTDLEIYLLALEQPWCEDATNADLHHTRNRVRQLLIPLLEREFNPSIRERLAELAEIARSESEAAELSDRLHQAEPGALDSRRHGALPVAVSRRLIRSLAAGHRLTLDFAQTEAVRALLGGEVHGTVELHRGWVAELIGGELRFRRTDLEPYTYEHQLTVPDEVPLPEYGVNIRLRVGRATGCSAGIDGMKLPTTSLILRPWRPGDRFWPQHSSGPKKVKEVLTDKHITGPERQLWPVIACGDDVVWLRGSGVSQQFVAVEGAEDAILITEHPLRLES